MAVVSASMAAGSTAISGKQAQAAAARRAEFLAAWRLAVWRAEEEKRFIAQLKEKEHARMQVLDAEWRRQAAEHASAVEVAASTVSSLEAEARKVLMSVRKQEAAVKAEREALAARLRGMEAEHGARGRQAAEAVEDLKLKFERQARLERQRTADAQAEAAKLASRCAAAEAALEELQKAQDARPAAKLARQLEAAKAVLVAAEARAADAAAAQQESKQQVVELVRALVAAQYGKAAESKPHVPRPEPANEQCTQHVAPAASGAQPGERHEAAAEAATVQQTVETPGAGNTVHLRAAKEREEVQRLVRERAALVATGIYGHGDALIQQLDARIGFLVAEQGTG